jgi:hypothetical protein
MTGGIKNQQTTLGKNNVDLHCKDSPILTMEEKKTIEELEKGRKNTATHT